MAAVLAVRAFDFATLISTSKRTAKAVLFCCVEIRGRKALCKLQASKKTLLCGGNSRGGQLGAELAQPIRSNSEDGVWVQTPFALTR